MVAVRNNFLVVPFTGGFQKAPLCGNHAVNRSVILINLKFLVYRCIVIQYLELHAHVGGITLKRGADTQSVVGTRCEHKLETEHKVIELLAGIQVAAGALAGVQHNQTAFYCIVFLVARPLIEAAAVEEDAETLIFFFCRKLKRFRTGKLLQKDVSVRHFAAVCLQFDLFNREDGLTSVPVVFENHVVGHQLTIQPHRYPFADHADAECIPFTYFLIGHHQRLAGVLRVVV